MARRADGAGRVVTRWSGPGARLEVARSVGPADLRGLDEAERARAEALADPTGRAAYALAHRMVRTCAEQFLSRPVGRFEQRCTTCAGDRGRLHGAPSFPEVPELGVSLSHSRDRVAVLAARGVCGVDVEVIDRERPPPLRQLPAGEAEWVRRQSDPSVAFLRLWSRKEALFKAGADNGVALVDVAVLGSEGPISNSSGLDLLEWVTAAEIVVAAVPVGSLRID